MEMFQECRHLANRVLGWLRERLTQFDGTSPKDLARELVTSSPQQATDDRTALVVRVERREAQRDA